MYFDYSIPTSILYLRGQCPVCSCSKDVLSMSEKIWCYIWFLVTSCDIYDGLVVSKGGEIIKTTCSDK